MPWDSSRPVPWSKLLRQWCIYAVVLLAVFLVLFRGSSSVLSSLVGVALSLPLFLGLNWMLYKVGRERTSIGELRRERAAAAATPTASAASAATGESGVRSRPAPSRRTSTGHNNPHARKRRR